ncbi:hypothetical protein [Corynebacterium aquilae]|uniref:Uncharacterized protein n=1 Tax=Corynebacterium aquilae DSM 44791 TaxID=1431546 RepID=A0A1L7CH83_9CORY|nr:hypothetical protein [Corynebacterium aquilae]APT85208.1 hypothetical protein CAQU_09130 [Corynebacterium aquilae DSM 44791]
MKQPSVAIVAAAALLTAACQQQEAAPAHTEHSTTTTVVTVTHSPPPHSTPPQDPTVSLAPTTQPPASTTSAKTEDAVATTTSSPRIPTTADLGYDGDISLLGYAAGDDVYVVADSTGQVICRIGAKPGAQFLTCHRADATAWTTIDNAHTCGYYEDESAVTQIGQDPKTGKFCGSLRQGITAWAAEGYEHPEQVKKLPVGKSLNLPEDTFTITSTPAGISIHDHTGGMTIGPDTVTFDEH